MTRGQFPTNREDPANLVSGDYKLEFASGDEEIASQWYEAWQSIEEATSITVSTTGPAEIDIALALANPDSKPEDAEATAGQQDAPAMRTEPAPSAPSTAGKTASPQPNSSDKATKQSISNWGPVVSISGTVNVPGGIDPRDIGIDVYTMDQSPVSYSNMNDDGTYEVFDLEPGQYKIHFNAYNSGAQSRWYGNADSFEGGTAPGSVDS